jgi:hypothetical protein
VIYDRGGESDGDTGEARNSRKITKKRVKQSQKVKRENKVLSFD